MEDTTKNTIMGRPPIEIDWKQFEALCRICCTLDEIAAWFNCSEDTIQNKCAEKYEETFSAVLKRISAGGRMSLRRRMHQQSRQGNIAATIFLAKQPPERGGLGMTDRVQQDSTVSLGAGTYEQLMGIAKVLEERKAAENNDRDNDGN